MPIEDGGVNVTLETIYNVVLETRNVVHELQQEQRTSKEVLGDHEGRLRSIEQGGGHEARERAKELERTRLRLHSLEGNVPTLTAAFLEHSDDIKALKEASSWLSRLAVGTAATFLVTVLSAVIIYLATH